MPANDHQTASTTKIRMDALRYFKVDAEGLSDIGCRRENNEDSFGYDLQSNIFVVCDGMGGPAAGEVASSTAVEWTMRAYKERIHENLSAKDCLWEAINAANAEVWRLARENRHLRGMGTTLVAACIRNGVLVIGNVGDSRAYHLRRGGWVQVTEDHSLMAEQDRLRAAGLLSANLRTPVSAQFQQVITRAVGIGKTVEPDFFAVHLEPGDTILLTTDGLTRHADGEEIAAHLREDRTLGETCRGLIAFAYGKGAEDNVTCLLLRLR